MQPWSVAVNLLHRRRRRPGRRRRAERSLLLLGDLIPCGELIPARFGDLFDQLVVGTYPIGLGRLAGESGIDGFVHAAIVAGDHGTARELPAAARPFHPVGPGGIVAAAETIGLPMDRGTVAATVLVVAAGDGLAVGQGFDPGLVDELCK